MQTHGVAARRGVEKSLDAARTSACATVLVSSPLHLYRRIDFAQRQSATAAFESYHIGQILVHARAPDFYRRLAGVDFDCVAGAVTDEIFAHPRKGAVRDQRVRFAQADLPF